MFTIFKPEPPTTTSPPGITIALLATKGLNGLVLLTASAWMFGAIWFDAPWGRANPWIAVVFITGLGLLLWRIPSARQRRVVWAGTWLAVSLAWLSQSPSNDRLWQTDVSKTARAEIHGDQVTLHHVRDFDYHRSERDCTPRWHTRSVLISSIEGMDVAVCYWGSPWISHPIVRFRFRDTPPLCISIEARKEVGETYSALGGFFHHFELIYIVAEETDVIRLRSDIRPGEEVYFYTTTISAAAARDRFQEYLAAINELHRQPRWYHAITTNCTTSIWTQLDATDRLPWDWRLLLNGRLDELLYEQGLLVTQGLPFAELKARAKLMPEAP